MAILCKRYRPGSASWPDATSRKPAARPIPGGARVVGAGEIAIAACDLAEVLGAAIALHLLFGLPLLIGVVLTAADTFVVLWLHARNPPD